MFAIDDCEYMREPLECFRDASVQELDLLWGTQVGKTTCVMVGLAYTIVANPRRSMLAFPTDDIARKFSKGRWQKLVDGSDVLQSHKPTNSDDFTNLEQTFDTCSVFFTGVGSAAKVSSEPISLLIEDEIDKFPDASAKESDARSLLEERTKSFVYKLIVRSSTPTIESGNIYTSYKMSDAREYFVECPHCSEWIVFDWHNIKWYLKDNPDDDWDMQKVKETAVYYCQHCGNPINDQQRRKMIARGKWQPTNLSAMPSHRGYHLSSLYAPSLTWADVATAFCKADDSNRRTDAIRNFVNSWLAETWEEETFKSDPELLKACSRKYMRGELKGVVRVITIDVQRRDLRYNVRGYDDSGSYLIDWGTCVDFVEVREKQKHFDASYVGIDINYRDRSQEAFDAIYEHRRDGWIALVGSGDKAQGNRPFVETTINAFTGKKGAKLVGGKILQLSLKSSIYKGEIARRRTGTASNWYVYDRIERGYVRELFAEVQAEKFEHGRRKYYWKQIRADNHQFDLECYQLAIADWAGLHKHGAIQFSPLMRARLPQMQTKAEAEQTTPTTRPKITREKITRSKITRK